MSLVASTLLLVASTPSLVASAVLLVASPLMCCIAPCIVSCIQSPPAPGIVSSLYWHGSRRVCVRSERLCVRTAEFRAKFNKAIAKYAGWPYDKGEDDCHGRGIRAICDCFACCALEHENMKGPSAVHAMSCSELVAAGRTWSPLVITNVQFAVSSLTPHQML